MHRHGRIQRPALHNDLSGGNSAQCIIYLDPDEVIRKVKSEAMTMQ